MGATLRRGARSTWSFARGDEPPDRRNRVPPACYRVLGLRLHRLAAHPTDA